MPKLADVITKLGAIAPLGLAEEWDNVGLLLGDPAAPADRALVCLTLTDDVADEAVREAVSLVVTHHPLPFRPIDRVTTETPGGAILWRLARAGVAVYSAHTAFDSAPGGANDHLAGALGIKAPAPLEARDDLPGGVGRLGAAPGTVGDLVERARQNLGAHAVRTTVATDRPAGRVAVACGSGGALLDLAIAAGAQTFVTGEASFHDCLKARAAGVAIVVVGHFASEHRSLASLAARLSEMAAIDAFGSRAETDPLRPV